MTTGAAIMSNVILDQIQTNAPGWIFSASTFSGLAPRNTIDQNLLRLTKAGRISKISTGLFCLQQNHPVLGPINPSLDDIVQAYGHKFGYQIQVHPLKAANLLGLSQQVPAKNIYLTDGPNRSLILGGQPVTLKHVCPRKLLGIGSKAGLIIQALYSFGVNGIDQSLTNRLKILIDKDDVRKLQDYLGLMPGWMQKVITMLVNDAF